MIQEHFSNMTNFYNRPYESIEDILRELEAWETLLNDDLTDVEKMHILELELCFSLQECIELALYVGDNQEAVKGLLAYFNENDAVPAGWKEVEV